MSVKLWTVWNDRLATGEGRMLMARICHASDAEQAVADFGKAFDPYFADGAGVAEGVQENSVTLACSRHRRWPPRGN